MEKEKKEEEKKKEEASIGGKEASIEGKQTPQLDRPDISWRDVPEGCVTGSKNPYWHGDRGARVAIIRRSADLAAEGKNDKKP
jgi:hypothetical protein